jgi:hypothetical protein
MVLNNSKTGFFVEAFASLSYQDLLRLKSDGESIVRSSHIGNIDAFTCTLLSDGFTVILHEHLECGHYLYRPNSICFEGEVHTVFNGSETVLTCSMNSAIPKWIKKKFSFKYGPFLEEVSLKKLHYETVSMLGISAILLSKCLNRIPLSIFEIWLTELVSNQAYVFHKYIDKSGASFKFSYADSFHIFFEQSGRVVALSKKICVELFINHLQRTLICFEEGLEATGIGILLSTEAYIVLTTLADICFNESETKKCSKQQIAYHLAGEKMTEYLCSSTETSIQYRENLQRIYLSLLKVTPCIIPDLILMKLVPVKILGKHLVSTPGGTNALYLLENYQKVKMDLVTLKKSFATEVSFKIPSDGLLQSEAKKVLNNLILNGLSQQKVHVVEKLFDNYDSNIVKISQVLKGYYMMLLQPQAVTDARTLLSTLKSRIVKEYSPKVCFSQYDIILSGERLYVGAEASQVRLNELKEFSDLLDSIIK